MEEYQPVKVEVFKKDQPVLFNVYLKIGDRFLLYCRKNTVFEAKRLNKLLEKKLPALYILSSEKHLYKQYLNQRLNNLLENKKLPLQTRCELIQEALQDLIESFIKKPQDEILYQKLLFAGLKYGDFLYNTSGAFLSIYPVSVPNSPLLAHSLHVATLALGILRETNFNQENHRTHLAVGAFLHDIAHFYTGFDITQNPKALSEEKQHDYRKHPRDGALKLKELSFFNPLIAKLVLQHEEKIDGSGFPQKLTEKNIEPLALIIGVANAFDKLIIQGTPPKDALKKMLINSVGEYPLDFLQALQSFLKKENLAPL
ncbi:MAG: HD domain-containing protein [Bdellovibrio sp.]|nr:MAG: HD domain-containing protein [Bdellovibrio sp.]